VAQSVVLTNTCSAIVAVMRGKLANAQHEGFIPRSDADSSAADVECRRALNPNRSSAEYWVA